LDGAGGGDGISSGNPRRAGGVLAIIGFAFESI
jgi:hypothetical protein